MLTQSYKIFFSCFLLLVAGRNCIAQDNNIYGNIGIGGNAVSSKHVPFWLRSNQFGDLPLPGSSGSIYGSLKKNYDTVNNPVFDWSASFEGRLNLGNKVRGILMEGYLSIAISEFEIVAGRSKSIIGLVDSSLSSGSFSLSGNALGIPQLQIRVPSYYSIPIWGELFAVKGNFSYGWMGDFPVQYIIHRDVKTYFHEKSLYIRFGKPEWGLKLFGGFNHQVMFGGERQIWGKVFDLNQWQTFVRAATGKTWNYSKVGNHIGSIDVGLQYDFENLRLSIYRQSFYDEGALYHLANIKDGLNGISFTNTSSERKDFTINKVLLEFLYSKDQAGYPTSTFTKSGDENYYNNYEYAEGWSYQHSALGNPLFSIRDDTRPFPNESTDFFNNNRIAAFNLGIDFSFKGIKFITKETYSKNYGTFGTSIYGHSTGRSRTTSAGLFPASYQISTYLEVSKRLTQTLTLGAKAALDYGNLLYNSNGIEVKLAKDL